MDVPCECVYDSVVECIVTQKSDTNSKQKILIVDGDHSFSKPLSEYLQGSGYLVEVISDGAQALSRIQTQQPQLVMLELNIPGENGLTVCKLSRRHYTGPVIMLSGRSDELDEVLCLDMGADDYICKPVSHRVMLARIQAHLRRTNKTITVEEEDGKERLNFGDLVIDNTMREAWLNNAPIELTSAEFDLLWLLSSHAGQIMTREEIFNKLRGIEYDGQDRSVDVRVSRIRPKVGDDPVHPRRIKTVRSKGYLFVGDLAGRQADTRILN